MRRDDRSMSNTLVREVAVENGAEYRAMFRMEDADFDYLLNLVSPLIAKQDTLLRTSISARERLKILIGRSTTNTARSRVLGTHYQCSRGSVYRA